jgi:acyl carrier protein
MNTEQTLIKIVAANLNIDDLSTITADTHLVDDLGADSLDAAEILFDIEDAFNIEVMKEEFQGRRTIKSLVELIESKI